MSLPINPSNTSADHDADAPLPPAIQLSMGVSLKRQPSALLSEWRFTSPSKSSEHQTSGQEASPGFQVIPSTVNAEEGKSESPDRTVIPPGPRSPQISSTTSLGPEDYASVQKHFEFKSRKMVARLHLVRHGLSDANVDSEIYEKIPDQAIPLHRGNGLENNGRSTYYDTLHLVPHLYSLNTIIMCIPCNH